MVHDTLRSYHTLTAAEPTWPDPFNKGEPGHIHEWHVEHGIKAITFLHDFVLQAESSAGLSTKREKLVTKHKQFSFYSYWLWVSGLHRSHDWLIQICLVPLFNAIRWVWVRQSAHKNGILTMLRHTFEIKFSLLPCHLFLQHEGKTNINLWDKRKTFKSAHRAQSYCCLCARHDIEPHLFYHGVVIGRVHNHPHPSTLGQ